MLFSVIVLGRGSRVLLDLPSQGREVTDSDEFAMNLKFTDNHKRIKINQIQMKESAEENAATTEKVFEDRQFAIDAAVVRIMKTRKKLAHRDLISALFEMLKFPCKVGVRYELSWIGV